MKIKQLTTLKHKLQWLLLLAALLGVSQGVWADYFHVYNGSWKDYNMDGSGVASITFTTTGGHDFKAVLGSTWYGNNGDYYRSNNNQVWNFGTNDGDCTVMVDEPGTYIFTKGWNNTCTVKITYPVPKTRGTWDNWATNNQDMTYSSEHVFTITKSLSANTTYTFGVETTDGTWYRNYNFTRENSGAEKQLETGGSNATIKTDVSGTYTFTFNNNTHKLKVTYPSCNAPSIETNSTPADVTGSGAKLKGKATKASNNGCDITTAGIALGTSSKPTTLYEYGVPTSGVAFEKTITDLSPGTRYYYRAYVTAGGKTTYGEEYTFYTKPDNIYIKGLIIYSGSGCPGDWPYDNTAFSKDGNVFTKTIIARKPGCSYSNVNADAEFILTTTQGSDDGKLNAKATFVADGDNANWSRSSRTGDHDEKYNFKYTADYNAGDQVLIIVTFVSDGTFKMRLCSSPTIGTDLSSSITWTKCGNAADRELSISASGSSGMTYQWFRNTAASETGATAVTDMDEDGDSYSPSSSDYGTYYYYCVVRSGGACSANKATSSFTGPITINQTPVITPAAVTVKQYEPVSLTATNSSVNWSITAHPGGAAADEYYLYDETKSSAMFKGAEGEYEITATSTGTGSCAATSEITVVEDDDEGCQ